MRLLKLQLQNFRNYEKFEIKFDKGKDINLIVGENGQGKTNILEAIFLLATGKVFREADQENLIKWEQDFFIVKGVFDNEKDQEEFGIFYSTYPRKEKVLKINEVETKYIDYLGKIPVVLFHPKDMNMLTMEPDLRRKYLNLILSQTDKYYLEAIVSYTKILKQRNTLLEKIFEKESSEKELDVWDEKLSKEAAYVIEARAKFCEYLNSHIQKNYQKISSSKEKIEVTYKSSISDTQNIESAFKQKLLLKRDKDIRFGTTTIGPHREDVKFLIDGHTIESSASRGETRTVLIALKLSEIAYIEKIKKTSPILLLDDVLSELDDTRQKNLLSSIKNCQTFITATKDTSGKTVNPYL